MHERNAAIWSHFSFRELIPKFAIAAAQDFGVLGLI